MLLPAVACAINAQWDLDPISGDWNTAANWTPTGIPNGPADIATFGLSHTTDVSISANTEVSGITFTSAATNPYLITVSSGLTLTLSGAGIMNNSGITQRFFIGDPFENGAGAQIRFINGATAGNANISCFDMSSSVQFWNRSSAGNATIATQGNDSGSIIFFNRSTAANATIYGISGGSVDFFDTSTAGSATITNAGALHMSVTFHDNSTAGSATLDPGEEESISFFDRSTAGSTTILGGGHGTIDFFDFSTAGSSMISTYATLVSFYGFSKGGTAAIQLLFGSAFEAPSWLDISQHNAPGVTIGSLEDDGTATAIVFLGANNLTIGSNNLSTTFSGVIQDGGLGGGGVGGSLTKIGTGTLDLTGANTYTGNTNINRGVLQVDGSITSNTFVNHGGTLAGAGTINGNVTNFGRVMPGALGVPDQLTVVHSYTQTQYATLMIQIAGTSAGQFSVLDVMGNANLNGYLDPVLLNGFVPTIGDSFTFLNYASFTGEFSHIKHQVFDNGMLQWSVIYQNNGAILTVGPNTIPDQGSTFLLMTLGLLGLVAYRRQLLGERP